MFVFQSSKKKQVPKYFKTLDSKYQAVYALKYFSLTTFKSTMLLINAFATVQILMHLLVYAVTVFKQE